MRSLAVALLFALMTLQSCSCEDRTDGGDPNHGADFNEIND